MKKKTLFLALSLSLLSCVPAAAQMQASFTADEAMTTYYSQGWDSVKAVKYPHKQIEFMAFS